MDTFLIIMMVLIIGLAGFSFFGIGYLTGLSPKRELPVSWVVVLVVAFIASIVFFPGLREMWSTAVILGSWVVGIAVGRICRR